MDSVARASRLRSLPAQNSHNRDGCATKLIDPRRADGSTLLTMSGKNVPQKMNLTFLLRSCRLFADLDAPELRDIQAITLHREYRKGQLIFTEGEVSRGFCVLAAGTVKIYRLGPDGRERIIHVVAAGDSFAEAAMFMTAYPATAEALSTATVLWIEKNGFKQLLGHDSKLSFKIMGALVQRLNHLRNVLTDLTLKEVPARFASYVLSLPAQPGQPIRINISKTCLLYTSPSPRD